jgi:hypothetical protein
MKMTTININPKSSLKITLLLSGFLVMMHILGMVSRFALGHDHLKGIVPLFNLEIEANIPTVFSSFLAFTCSAILLFIAKLEFHNKKTYRHWIGLSFIFLFIAFDEIVGFHEMTMQISRSFFNTSGILYYSWTIPAGIIVLIVGIVYLKFLFVLERPISKLFIISGFIYVSGAIGIELFEGLLNEQGGYMSLEYLTLVTVEESMEMLGLCIFLYGNLKFLETIYPSLSITIGHKKSATK